MEIELQGNIANYHRTADIVIKGEILLFYAHEINKNTS